MSSSFVAGAGAGIEPPRHDNRQAHKALVRAKIAVEARIHETASVEDADFYVTTQGVLGEQFLSDRSGNAPDKPVRR